MKILMVCLGNICRSPMADGIMRHISEKRSLNLTVDSAGTANYHVGEQPDIRMQKTAIGHGIDLSELRARQFAVSDFNDFDLIFAMDESNYNNILALNNNQAHPRVKMILDEIAPGQNLEVPDPYYGGDSGFDDVYQMLNNACITVADKIDSGEYK